MTITCPQNELISVKYGLLYGVNAGIATISFGLLCAFGECSRQNVTDELKSRCDDQNSCDTLYTNREVLVQYRCKQFVPLPMETKTYEVSNFP